MAEDESGEKTEEATPQRREDFRKKGQVAQSKDLGSVLVLLAVVLILWGLSGFYYEKTMALIREVLSYELLTVVRTGDMKPVLLKSVQALVLLLSPVFLGVFVISLLSSFMQVGFLVNEEALEAKWDRVDPIQGLQRIFSLRNLFEGAKSLFKIILVGLAVYFFLKGEFSKWPHLTSLSTQGALFYIVSISLKMILIMIVVMFIIATGDYFYQKFDLEKKMMMSKQEIKEEMKSREGDPLIKSRIRRIQRDLAQRRMMDAVPKADVIITNPTHIAVAIQYTKEMMAPVVVAMGADLIAEKIRELAKENHIPIVENKPLARTIFKTLKIGNVIPRELYGAVAEVLSYVYRLKKRNL